MSTSSRQSLRPLFVLSIVLVVAGCADLKEITKFSETSANAVAFTAVIDDYPEIAVRELRYKSGLEKDAVAMAAQERLKQKKGLLALHKAIVDYMVALGKVASDEAIELDKATADLKDSIKNAGKLGNNDAEKKKFEEASKAAGAFVELMGEGILNLFRQHELSKIISKTNEPFQDLIGKLQIVTDAYDASLASEQGALDGAYYSHLPKGTRGTETPEALLLQSAYVDRTKEISALRQSARHSREILQKIGEGHDLLYRNRNKLSAKDVLDHLKGYKDDIQNLYAAVKELKK